MTITINNLDPQPTQASQDPSAKAPVDRARETHFASLMQTLSKDKAGPAKASSTQPPAPGSTEDRIYKAVHTAAEKYNLPPALILGVIKQESGFKQNAKSWCGAQGYMQLMPGTAKQLGVKDAYNLEQNIDGGSKYLRMMLDEFDGNVKKAVAAYNCGPGNVRKAEKRGLEVPNIEETKNYVPAVLAHAEKFNNGAPIVVPGSQSVAVAAASSPIANQKIDYNLVIEAVHSADQMTQAAMSLAIASNIQPLELPKSESSKADPEPPPPPPPRGVRV